jgi:hypothetical protein
MLNYDDLSPLDVAVALSLYAYNVSAAERAEKLYRHFHGECMEVEELYGLLFARPAYAASQLPAPTAEVYVDHALERYGAEAKRRNRINLQGATE